MGILDYLKRQPVIAAIIIAVIVLLLIAVFRIVSRRNGWLRSHKLDSIADGVEFEHYVAWLLEEQGFHGVQVTKGSGDFGADVLARRDGVRYAIQCKLYSQPVGVKAVQEICAGRDYYHCHVGIVATNNHFTSGAEVLADKTRTVLWSGDRLARMEKAASAKK
ncbi:MAG: restriction endonuclease [Oscillospiraceae bacterium]